MASLEGVALLKYVIVVMGFGSYMLKLHSMLKDIFLLPLGRACESSLPTFKFTAAFLWFSPTSVTSPLAFMCGEKDLFYCFVF